MKPVDSVDVVDDDEMIAQRQAALDNVLDSDAPLKVMVAGPGTGKTFTFGRVVDRAQGAVLVLSFLNNLVADLDAALGDRAEVRTFHAYCRLLLHNMDVPGITRGVDFYPHLRTIIEEDLALTIAPDLEDGALEGAFMNLDDSAGLASAGLHSGDYYDAVGYTDGVYRIFQLLASSSDLIPAYGQILVDEYQDFSLLEVSLIELMSTVSPTLIVGDDDQALYSFKHASADYLRDLVARGRHARFELPFCTRCTEVLVDATHRVVRAAQAQRLLTARIDKPYVCFMPEKRPASVKYPRIIHADCTVERVSAPYMCRYVAQKIPAVSPEDVAASAGKHPTVLVVAPPEFAKRVYSHLVDKGVPNVTFGQRPRTEIDILDAYRRIARRENSRLGWRILLHVLQPPGWEDAVRAALDGAELSEAIDPEFRQHHLAIARVIRLLVDHNDLSPEDTTTIEGAIGSPLTDVLERMGLVEKTADEPPTEGSPTVTVTNLQGAKGLQAEHVYVVGMNNGHFPRNNAAIEGDEVCSLLVALTRARQSCTLISCQRFGNNKLAQSAFLTWLKPLLDRQPINADYWKT